MSKEPMLLIRSLDAWYDKARVIRGIDLDVYSGEICSVLGRNGAGKSTLAKAVMGLLRKEAATEMFDGTHLGTEAGPVWRARHGIGYVPEDRRIFGNLTVRGNLLVGCRSGRTETALRLGGVMERFPVLERKMSNYGDQLSGGEQQILAIGRALMGKPRILVVDEPCEGLAPVVVEELKRVLVDLAQNGVGVLLIEQSLRLTMEVADRVYILVKGEVAWSGARADFQRNGLVMERFLGSDVARMETGVERNPT